MKIILVRILKTISIDTIFELFKQFYCENSHATEIFSLESKDACMVRWTIINERDTWTAMQCCQQKDRLRWWSDLTDVPLSF